MTVAYWMDCELFNINPKFYEDCYEKCSSTRKEKVDAYHFDKDKYLSVGIATLFRYGIYKQYGLTQIPKICYSRYQKPILCMPDVYFNCSHSGNIAVCAFSDAEVGVDVEVINPNKEILKCVLTSEEQKVVESCKHPMEQFIRLWTSKEAYAKYTGKGIGEKFEHLDCSKVITNGSFKYKSGYFYTDKIEENILTIYGHDKNAEIIQMKLGHHI